MKLYPSSIGRVIKCPASKNKPNIEIDTTSQATIEGTAYHEAMEMLFNDNGNMQKVIDIVESKYDVVIGFMVYNTFRIISRLEELGVHLEETEEKIKADYGDYELSGRFDAKGYLNEYKVIVDYKGGYKDTSAESQLTSYCSIINQNEDIEKFKIIAIHGRLNTYEVLTVDLKMINDFNDSVKKALKSNKYMAGDHCEYCPLQYECPAKTKLINNAVSILGTGELMQNPADLFDRVKEIKKAVANYEEQFKDYVLANGVVQDSEGRTFLIKESEGAQYLNDPKIVEAIKNRLGNDYFDNQKIRKTDLKKAVMDATERGLKKAEWEAFELELQEIEGGHFMKSRKTLTRKK